MKFNPKQKKSVILAVLILSAVACSSKPDVKEFPSSANAKEEITNLQFAMNNTKDENYEIFAPVSFQKAEKSLDEAREMVREDKSNKKVLEEVALGRAYLERAKEKATENKEKLQDVVAARETAIEAEADTLLPNMLSEIDKKVEVVAADLEKGREDKLKERRSDLITGYLDLELAAIKKKNLGESKFLIDQAVKNGARDLTPQTLSKANKKYKEVEQFITQNRHDTEQIRSMSDSVLQAARSLESTVATARGLTAATPEETALKMQMEEARLNQTQEALSEERGENKALGASLSEMEKQQRLNAIYEQARNKFTPEEADVYKKGNNLVIRLKSLKFPQSQAVLKAQDFALLKKVEEVIESFDKSNVIVEGHTDSTGGKQINQKLSNQRAEAVKKYLEANAPDNISEIESHGLGYEKPLATNKTPEGRAQNRRVDVIIEPTQL